MEAGRLEVASFIHGHPDEIVFTSGGTEANGLALEAAGRTAHRKGIEKPHIIISTIEHSSIVETANMLEKHGVEVTRIPVDATGVVSVDEIKRAIKPSTYMVSIMMVNNEIGSIQPIREIAKAIRWARANVTKTQYPLFHTDAAQAALYMDLNVEQLGVDLMTLDGTKMCGPRGIGFLYVRRNTPIEQIIYGGGQERGLRSGTENIPGIMGFAESCRLAARSRKSETARIQKLKNAFVKKLRKIRPDAIVAGGDVTAPHILNVSLPGIDNEFFVLKLDAKGVAASTKSSCLRDEDESYVLKAIGADSKTAVRFSFGRWTKRRDIKGALKIIARTLTS
ncbi:MAG: hypothetical protein JWO00_39 [Candidatus Parcubacteria bacterium]|nr:hypothetical protein [Candidatus Parcubacteria bacterium]